MTIFLNQWIAFSWKILPPAKIFYFQQMLMDGYDFILLKKRQKTTDIQKKKPKSDIFPGEKPSVRHSWKGVYWNLSEQISEL